jgi:hypothetical protein
MRAISITQFRVASGTSSSLRVFAASLWYRTARCALLPISCLALISVLTGCQAPTPAAKFIEQADRLHNGALASTAVADTELDEYLHDVSDRIAKAAKMAAPNRVNEEFIARVHCQLVASDTINAFTTGGTHIYVTNGLFQQCQSEEELATAVAHAYAHLIDLDLEATKIQPEPTRPLTMVAWDFVLNRFTREQEKRADALAMAIYAQAGWDTVQYPNLYQHMEAVSAGNIAPDRDSLPARAFALEAIANDLKRPFRRLPVADPKTFIMLRQRAAQYREPTVTGVPQIFLRAFPNCILSGDTTEQRAAQERLRPVAPPPVKIEPN